MGVIVLFFLYLANYMYANPEYFIYSPRSEPMFPDEPPMVFCELDREQIYEEVGYFVPDTQFSNMTKKGLNCAVMNIPSSKDDVYVKKANPFIFYLLKYQGILLVLTLIWVAIDRLILRRKKKTKEPVTN